MGDWGQCVHPADPCTMVDQECQGGARARDKHLPWKEISRLVHQPRVHRPGLSSHPFFAHDTLRIDRADLMRLPRCGAEGTLLPGKSPATHASSTRVSGL